MRAKHCESLMCFFPIAIFVFQPQYKSKILHGLLTACSSSHGRSNQLMPHNYDMLKQLKFNCFCFTQKKMRDEIFFCAKNHE